MTGEEMTPKRALVHQNSACDSGRCDGARLKTVAACSVFEPWMKIATAPEGRVERDTNKAGRGV